MLFRLLTAALLIGTATGARAQPYNPGQNVFVSWITTTLAGNGYTVLQGTATTSFPNCDPFISAFGSCFGNNSATPYLFPQPPNTSGVPGYATALNSGLSGTQPNNPAGSQATNDIFQLNPNDAIVTIITMPPRLAYFGFQTYDLERAPSLYGQTATGSTCNGGTKAFGYVQTADCNYEVFGNFANTINHADIATAVAAFNGNPWNTYDTTQSPPVANSSKTIAIITTPNKTLAANMRALFAGDSTRIFTETMPASVKSGDAHTFLQLHPCTTDVRTPCDAFASVIRTTLAQSSSLLNVWQTGNNIVVYRVTSPTVGTAPSDLYDTDDVYNSLYTQGCNTNETGAFGALASCANPNIASSSFDYDLQQIAAVLQSYGQATVQGDTYGYYEASGTGRSLNGGVGNCLATGVNCAGATQDTDSYRVYSAGTMKNLAPIFVVGVLHSTSPADFTPTASYPVAAVNNADYTGISIADNSPAPGKPLPAVSQNYGIADAANPNSTSQYSVISRNRVLLGSAYTVLAYLTDASGHTLYSLLPASVQQDINNIYIHVFQRNDGPSPKVCSMQTCANNLNNDVTPIVTGPSASPPDANNPGVIPDPDNVLFTERGYVLPPAVGTPQTTANFTGAAVQYLQSPYIVCDVSGTGCGGMPQ